MTFIPSSFIGGSSSGGASGATCTLNFGAFDTDAAVVVTGQAWVLAGSRLAVSLYGTTEDHLSPEEGVIEQITVSVGDIVAGTGFTVYGAAPNGTTGTYTAHVVGGA